jgi:predicted RNase H-like nuclease (RuvC/YqgF family)
MSSELKEILTLIEQLETYFDEYIQSFQKNSQSALQNLSNTWKMIKLEQDGVNKYEETNINQNSEITELKIKLDDLSKKVNNLKSINNELITKNTELNSTVERLNNELTKPLMELEETLLKLSDINQKIITKEKENTELEQKKIDNENRESQLKTLYTIEKMEDLDQKMQKLKRNNYFTSFIIENSEEEIPEVDIIATIMNQGSCDLDELKKLLDVPPIMAVRTIKQLAVKGIIKLDEDTNIVTLP